MLAVLNLIMSYDRYPPPMGNPHNDELKIGDLVLIKNQTPKIGDKSSDVPDPTGKVKRVIYDL